MPPLAAAVAVALSVSVTMAYVVIVTAVIMLASLAYSAYMMATMETPKTPDAMKRNQTVRSAVQPHRVIYGEVLTGGVLVYAQSHGDNNAFITLVVAFTGHEVEEIKEIWLNDKVSTDQSFQLFIPAQPAEGYWQSAGTETESGTTDGTVESTWVETRAAAGAHFVSHVQITKYLGTADQEADPLLLSLPPKPTVICSKRPEMGLDDLHVVDPVNGGAYSTYTGAGMCVITVTVTATAPTGDTIHWVQSIYEGDGQTQINVASGSAVLTAAPVTLVDGIKAAFGAYVVSNFIFSTTGHTVGQSWEIRAFDGSPWTADCRLRGRSYVVVTLANDDKVFPNGLPNIRAVIKGNNQIYDPRTGATGFTDNWALCIRDYLTKPYGLNCTADEINEDFAIAAANICDEMVAMAKGSQKRYTLNGSFTLDKTPTNIMNEILASAYGAITWTQGQYRILPAAYYAPDLSFHGLNPSVPGLTESDLRGDIKVRPRPSMKDRFNTVKGTYISTETWQPIDFPKVTNAMYVAEDGGEEIARDIQLTYITDCGRAQRIAKVMLEKGRQGITVEFPAKWSAFPLAVGDNVPVSIALLGWDQKIFTVRDWRLNPDGGIDLTLMEEAEGCYDWNNGEETTVDLAPNTILPDPNFSQPPQNIKVGEELYVTNVGSIVKSRVILNWDVANVRQYEVQYISPNNTIWAALPFTTQPAVTIDDTTPGPYSFRLRSMNYLGLWGDWSTLDYLVLGKSAPPPPVDTFLVSAQPDGTREFTWTLKKPPLDMAGFRIRYCAGTSGTFAAMTEMHSGLLLASPFESNQLAAGEYTFGIVSEDTTGNQSDPAYITTTIPDPRMAGIALSASCGGLGWPGTKTGCYVNEAGELENVGTGTWATHTSWSSWTAWNSNPTSPIQYDHPALDLGVETKFTPIISAQGDGTPTITVATSVDGITYSSYAAPATVSARYIKVRVSMAGAYPILRSVIVYLSAQQITEDINDLNTLTLSAPLRLGIGDVRLPRSKSYSLIQNVTVTLQGTGAGWTWKLIDKDTTLGPRIQIYDGTGALADTVIDATIKGL